MKDWLVIGSGTIASGIMRVTPNALQVRRPDHDIGRSWLRIESDEIPRIKHSMAFCKTVTGVHSYSLPLGIPCVAILNQLLPIS